MTWLRAIGLWCLAVDEPVSHRAILVAAARFGGWVGACALLSAWWEVRELARWQAAGLGMQWEAAPLYAAALGAITAGAIWIACRVVVWLVGDLFTVTGDILSLVRERLRRRR